MLVSENKTLPVAFKQPSNFTIIQSSLPDPEISGRDFASPVCLPACLRQVGQRAGSIFQPSNKLFSFQYKSSFIMNCAKTKKPAIEAGFCWCAYTFATKDRFSV